MNENIARQITKLGGDTIRTTRQDTAAGYQILSFVSDLPGGAISSVVVDLNMPKDRALLLDTEKVKARYLTQFMIKMLHQMVLTTSLVSFVGNLDLKLRMRKSLSLFLKISLKQWLKR